MGGRGPPRLRLRCPDESGGAARQTATVASSRHPCGRLAWPRGDRAAEVASRPGRSGHLLNHSDTSRRSPVLICHSSRPSGRPISAPFCRIPSFRARTRPRPQTWSLPRRTASRGVQRPGARSRTATAGSDRRTRARAGDRPGGGRAGRGADERDSTCHVRRRHPRDPDRCDGTLRDRGPARRRATVQCVGGPLLARDAHRRPRPAAAMPRCASWSSWRASRARSP